MNGTRSLIMRNSMSYTKNMKEVERSLLQWIILKRRLTGRCSELKRAGSIQRILDISETRLLKTCLDVRKDCFIYYY